MGEKKRTINTIGIILLIFAAIIVLIFFILFNGRETYTSDDRGSDAYLALDCKTGAIDEAFFTSSTVNTISNHLKVTFNKDGVDKIFYSFEGVYRSEGDAEQDNAVLHARYNKHMSEYGIYPEVLTPTFSTVNTKLTINLYAKNRDVITRGIGTLFFIDDDNLESFLKYSRDQVADYYKDKGFSCKKQN